MPISASLHNARKDMKWFLFIDIYLIDFVVERSLAVKVSDSSFTRIPPRIIVVPDVHREASSELQMNIHSGCVIS